MSRFWSSLTHGLTPYVPGEHGTDIEKLGKKVAEEFDAFEKKHQRHLQVWFEPGKFLVSEAGYFVAKVNVLKESGNTSFVGLDTGLNHLIRPMFYGSYHAIENISHPGGALRAGAGPRKPAAPSVGGL